MSNSQQGLQVAALTHCLHLRLRACPYSLPVASCGHSFCAICCLRWFFHYLEVDKTVVYHRSVDCPVCEGPLADFSILDEWRERSTFPFIPNGLAVDAIDSHFLLFDSALKSGSSGPEGTESGSGEERRQEDTDLRDLVGLDLKQTNNWKRGGEERLRWEERARFVARFSRTRRMLILCYRLGKEKMSMLEKMWALSPPEAFSQFKADLGPLGS